MKRLITLSVVVVAVAVTLFATLSLPNMNADTIPPTANSVKFQFVSTAPPDPNSTIVATTAPPDLNTIAVFWS